MCAVVLAVDFAIVNGIVDVLVFVVQIVDVTVTVVVPSTDSISFHDMICGKDGELT